MHYAHSGVVDAPTLARAKKLEPGTLLCEHIDSEGRPGSMIMAVTGFGFIKDSANSTDVCGWIAHIAEGNVAMCTDERTSLRVHFLFELPADAIQFKLTFADILDRI